ncbi:response regulator [Paenibacillus swuensis]|uniref:response regulator n=1 Tax=Paenibacillus swuensis TaxID=1178515 RepID=UPI000839A1F9|nr:response regulator [Paenibacillus swuensis]
MRDSLRYQILIWMLVITTLALSFVGAVNYKEAKRHMLESLETKAGAQVQSSAGDLASWLHTRQAELRVVSHTGILQTGTATEIMDYLRNERIFSDPDIIRNFGYARDDSMMSTTNGYMVSLEQQNPDLLLKVHQGKYVLSDPFFIFQGAVNKVFMIEGPVYDEHKEYKGVIAAFIYVDELFRKYTGFRSGSVGTHYIMKKDGTLIYQRQTYSSRGSDDSAAVKKKFEAIVPVMSSQLSGSARHHDDIAFFARIKDTDWVLVSNIPLEQYMSPLRKLQQNTVLTVLFAELLLCAVIYFMIQRFTKRISGIVKVTKKVAAGHFTVQPIPLTKNDEIDSLASSVNGMVGQLKIMFDHLEAIINQNGYGMIVVNTDFKVTYFNRAAEHMLGYTAADVIHTATPMLWLDEREVTVRAELYSRELDTLVQPDTSVLVCKKLRGMKMEEEWTLVHASGHAFPVSLNIGVIHQGNDQERGYVFTLRDITEEKQIRRELVKAKEEAVEASGEKSMFLARMSHELRTPLNGMIGLSQLMHKTTLTYTQQDYLNNIQASSQSLLHIINDILDYSKAEAGKIELEKVRFKPEALVRKVADTLSVFHGKKPLEFIIDVDLTLPRYLIGDSLRLEQVLLNLCGNAIKFTNHGHIALRIQEIYRSEGRTRLQFQVEDTGIGMSEEQLSRLFTPFTQADESTSREYGGTGLGLVISKSLIEMLGGTLQVKSTPGSGTSFSFCLEFDRLHETGSKTYQLPDFMHHAKVLLVEDHPVLLRNMQSVLLDLGLEVTVAGSWNQAFYHLDSGKAFDHREWDYLIMDMECEDMYGQQTWSRLQQAIAGKRTLTIALTTVFGRDAMLEMTRVERPGAVIVKPVDRSNLFQALLSTVERRSRNTADPDLLRTAFPSEGRILLAEDHPINQQVAVELLSARGYTVQVAANGMEVMEWLPKSAWDLILMDLHMPEMDGLSTARAIRRQPGYESIPIIAITASTQKNEHIECYRSGMNDIVTKPVDEETLLHTVQKWLIPKEHRTSQQATTRYQPMDLLWEETDGMRIDGIHTQRVLHRLNGKKNILMHMLRTFAMDYEGFHSRLSNEAEAGNDNTVLRLLHTLKGASGNLSAERLFAAVSRLEEGYTDNEWSALAPEREALRTELERLIRAIGTMDTMEAG